ncbi:MAG: hypothetical protein J7K35_09720 [Syntrophobacterales bacterium]|nr:hypothetical protein [Syntrophobacterales bacterium]
MNREYCEMVVEGSLDLVKGFVIGFLEGKGIQGEAIFGEDHHVQNEGKLGHMLHLVGMKGNRLHIIIGNCSQQRLLKDAMERRKEEIDLKLVSEKKIVQASFVFRYRAYTKDLGDELKELFDGLPEGLQIEDYEPKETVYPEGRGIEAYAPLHEYEVKAGGRIYGFAGDVINFYSRAERHGMVKLDDIKLEYAD